MRASRPSTHARALSDAEIAKLDRPGIWLHAWCVRGFGSNSKAGIGRARRAIARWERLTGNNYAGAMPEGDAE